MTSVFGGQVADEWDTVFPLIARDYALGLRAENRRRVERDEPPLSLDETLEAALEKTAADVIQPTHWPNIDLIGAQLNLYWAEFQIPVWRTRLRGWKLWTRSRTRCGATACSTATTWSSSILPLPSAISPSTGSLPERLGLRLVDRLRQKGGTAQVIQALEDHAPDSPEAELAVLEGLLRPLPAQAPGLEADPVKLARGVTLEQSLKGKTLTFRLKGPGVTPELRAAARRALLELGDRARNT